MILLRSFFRLFRWLSLAGLITVIVMILYASPPPKIANTPEAAQRAELKVQEFQASVQQGLEQTLQLDEAELNGWLGANLAVKRREEKPLNLSPTHSQESGVSLAKDMADHQLNGNPTVEQVQSSVRDVRIELLEDSLRAYTVFDLHGLTLTLELEGRLLVHDGCLRLEPSSGKLGSLPLSAGTLRDVAKRLFESDENKEKFRLPPHIGDVRIAGRELIVSSR